MDVEFIRTTIARLRSEPRAEHVFDISTDSFVLLPPVQDAEVAVFEARYAITLPVDYRCFLLEVGNGGAGPGYGILPLGTRTVQRHPTAFDAHVESGWSASLPFNHRYAWNRTPPPNGSEPEHFLEFECWQEEYLDPWWMSGAVPISSLGCGLTDWLVVTGCEYGHVWGDYRADGGGIVPLGLPGKQRITFGDWYLSWLHHAVAVVEGREPLPPLPEVVPQRAPTLFDGIE